MVGPQFSCSFSFPWGLALTTTKTDFDFGDAKLIELSSQLKFPWLLSNGFHHPAGDRKRLLGSGQEYLVRHLDNGLRVGFIGLAGTYVSYIPVS